MLQVNDGLGLVDGQPTKDGQSTKGQCGVGQPSEGQPCDPSLPSTVNGEWKSLSSFDVEPIWRQGPKKRDTIHTSLPFQRTHRGQQSAKLLYHAMAVMQTIRQYDIPVVYFICNIIHASVSCLRSNHFVQPVL